MRTRLGIFSKAASEAAFLVACVTVPVFFNFYSRRLFEPDKGAWLRTLILCGLVFWGVGALESRGESRRVKGRKRPEAEDSALVEQQTLPLLRNPLIWSIIAYLLAYLIATVFSIQPVLSWWGSYDRAEGFMAILGYGGAFGLGLAVLSRPGAIGRFWRGVCLTGIAVAFYAVLQRLGLDAGLWDIQEPTVRVFGTFGNPIFLGSYLLLVFPLTLLGSLGYPFPGESRRPDKRGRLLYGTGAALQAIGLILTLSRGPFLGLITEIGIILILWAVLQDRKRLLAGVLAAVIVIAGVLLVASQPDAPLKFARDLPYAGRLVGSLDATSRTSQTRLLTWGAILKLLDREPARWLVGYGSDTLILTFGQVFPEALVSLSNTVGTLYDRAHNVILDALYTGGLLGALATLGIYACAFAAGLRYVWPAARRFQYMLLWILMAGLSLAGGGIALLAPGLNPYFGILAGLGLLAGVILWLIWHPWMETREPNAAAESDIAEKLGREQDRAKINWPMIVLIAAIAGHLVEMQFGIAIVATSFLFWIELAVLVILPQSVWGKDTYSQPAESGNGGFSWMFWGMVTAILMITFIFDFVTPEISLRNAGVPIALLLFFTWVSGLMLYSAEEKSTERIKFVILSLTLTGLYFILHLLLVAEKRGEWLWWGYQGVLVLLLLVWAGGGQPPPLREWGMDRSGGGDTWFIWAGE
ncbi:MAG: hypothetical protein EXR62_02220 [Chloroflexi bacterium]|nr:hypothetical protein [Chloroflexota bacterium]